MATAVAYTQPLAVDESAGHGLVVRLVDRDGNPITIRRQQHEECWRSTGDPYSGNGYVLYFRKEVPWLERAFRIYVAENVLPAEHEAARQKARRDRIAVATSLSPSVAAA